MRGKEAEEVEGPGVMVGMALGQKIVGVMAEGGKVTIRS